MPSQKNRDELGAPTEICHNGGEIGHKSGKKRAGTAKAGQEPSRILPAFLVQSIHSQECQVVVSCGFSSCGECLSVGQFHTVCGDNCREKWKKTTTVRQRAAGQNRDSIRYGGLSLVYPARKTWSRCESWKLDLPLLVMALSVVYDSGSPSDGLDETLPRKGSRAWRDAMNHSQPEQNPLPK